MIFPYPGYFLDRNTFSFGEEEEDEQRHNDNKSTKEVEQSELHFTEHGEEELPDDKREKHVHGDINRLAC